MSDPAMLRTVAHQVPLSIGFSMQKYWTGLLSPPPGDLPDPGIELVTHMSPPMAGGFCTTSTTWEAALRASCGITATQGTLHMYNAQSDKF